MHGKLQSHNKRDSSKLMASTINMVQHKLEMRADAADNVAIQLYHAICFT